MKIIRVLIYEGDILDIERTLEHGAVPAIGTKKVSGMTIQSAIDWNIESVTQDSLRSLIKIASDQKEIEDADVSSGKTD